MKRATADVMRARLERRMAARDEVAAHIVDLPWWRWRQRDRLIAEREQLDTSIDLIQAHIDTAAGTEGTG